MTKKMTALIMAMSLAAAAAAGCKSSENGTASTAADSGSSAADESATGGSLSAEGDTQGTDSTQGENLEDVAEIVMAFYSPRAISTDDVQRVTDAINAITVPEISTSVTLLSLEQGNWDQQINLMISGGEQLDLLPTFFYGSTAISALKAQNQLNPLDDLLAEYGQDLTAAMPEGYFNATTQDGSIYGVPVISAKAGGSFCFMRKDVLEELGLLEAAQSADSMADLEAIFQTVKDETDLTPIVPASTSGVWNFANVFTTGDFADAVTYEDLIGGYIGILSDNPNQIVNLYDTEAYQESCRMLQRWYEAGYIYADAATDDQMPEEYIKAGTAFCYFNGTELNALDTVNQNCQQEMVPVEIARTPLTTWNVGTITWTIPVTAREPEAAMKFLNMMYTDERIVNLLNYGVENEDYVVGEDGRFSFPEGKDMNSVGYYNGYTWLFGNQFLAGVRDTEASDIREKGQQYDAEATLSSNFGFSANSTGMDTQIAGMTSAKNEYVRGLNCGIGDADANLSELHNKMEAAGVQDVIDNVQQQLETWQASQE